MNTLSEKEINILENALKLFALLGYEQTSLERIACEAGVGKGTIYLYFDNKLHLLLTILVQGLVRLKQGLEILAAAPGENGLERLSSLVNTYFSFVRENTEFFKVYLKEQDRLLVSEEKIDIRSLMALKEGIRQKFAAEMHQLIHAGLLPAKDPQWYAVVLNGLIIHCALERIFSEDAANVREKGAMIVAAFLTEVKIANLDHENISARKERLEAWRMN